MKWVTVKRERGGREVAVSALPINNAAHVPVAPLQRAPGLTWELRLASLPPHPLPPDRRIKQG